MKFFTEELTRLPPSQQLGADVVIDVVNKDKRINHLIRKKLNIGVLHFILKNFLTSPSLSLSLSALQSQLKSLSSSSNNFCMNIRLCWRVILALQSSSGMVMVQSLLLATAFKVQFRVKPPLPIQRGQAVISGHDSSKTCHYNQ